MSGSLLFSPLREFSQIFAAWLKFILCLQEFYPLYSDRIIDPSSRSLGGTHATRSFFFAPFLPYAIFAVSLAKASSSNTSNRAGFDDDWPDRR
jgi:hypothetical protein